MFENTGMRTAVPALRSRETSPGPSHLASWTLTALMTPWYRRACGRAGYGPATTAGSVRATTILDHHAAEVTHLVERSRAAAGTGAGSSGPVALLSAAHRIIRDEVRAVYAMDERTPTSATLARGFGSCSQRFAILESVARAARVPTRVRALLIDRSFWYPRFPRVRALLPDAILLVWPEFDIDGWKSASELLGPVGCSRASAEACPYDGAFTNSGSETLFEAAGRGAVDWEGETGGGQYDLSRYVRCDFGCFTDRDDAFARLGQTLCTPLVVPADLVLRRIAA